MGNEEIRKLGACVRVRPGVKDPDYESFSMEGWQGIVIEYIKNDPGELEEDEEWVHEESVHIRWDSVTLAEMPPKMIEECLDDGLDFETICLSIEDVEPAEPRDKPGDAEARAAALRDENIKYPCILTGAEDFSWEEPYLFGSFSQKEYNELKKRRPSYTDRYNLKSLEGIDDLRGILVKVKRIGDKKSFILPLWDLKTAERKDPNHQLIDDYSYWMSNYR